MRAWFIPVVFLLATLNSIAAPIRAGTAKALITPHSRAWLAGFPGRALPAEPASGDIFARALALEDGSGGRAVVLSVELLAIPRAVSERVAAELMKAHGLERGQIVINASGTCSGPFLKGLLPVLAPNGTNEQREIADYTTTVARSLVDLASLSLANMQPARLSFASGEAAFAVQSRVHEHAGDSELNAMIANAVPVLRVATIQGDIVALVFGYACRNAALGVESDTIGGDYAGIAATTLERDYPGSVALFLRLCDGDRSPAESGSKALENRYGVLLAAEVKRLLSLPMQPISGRLRATLIEISLAFVPHTRTQFEAESKSDDPQLARRASLVLRAYDARLEPRTLPYSVQAIRIGKGFALIALAGEPVTGYAVKMRKMLGQKDLIVAGGTTDAGYVVPDADADDFKNRHLADSIVYSGFPGAFTIETEERILGAVERVWKRLGK